MRTTLFMSALVLFFWTSTARASVYFPKEQGLSKRCIGLSKAIHVATQKLLGIGGAQVDSSKTTSTAQANKHAYRLGTKAFAKITCNSRKGNELRYSVQIWKVVPPQSFSAGKTFKVETTSRLSLGDTREVNGEKILTEMRKVLKPIIPPTKNSADYYTRPIRPTRSHAVFAAAYLPFINKIAVNTMIVTGECASYQLAIVQLLNSALHNRLVIKRTQGAITPKELNSFGYKNRATATISLQCSVNPTRIVQTIVIRRAVHRSEWNPSRAKINRIKNVFTQNMPTSKKAKALALASRVRSILEQASAQKLIQRATLSTFDFKRLSKNIVSYMPIGSRLNAAQFLRFQKRKEELRTKRLQKPPPQRKVLVPIQPKTRKLAQKRVRFPITFGLEAGGMMFYLGQPSLLGCGSAHFMYKPLRLGAMGGACLGDLPGKQGFDLFAFGGLSFLVADIPRVMNMTISASIAFHYYASELQEYGDKGTVPFWALMGIGLFVDTRFRPHQFLSFGVKMGWHPGLYEQRSLHPTFTLTPFSLQLYVSM